MNGRATQGAVGDSLFEAAAGIGLHVPTTCVKQGKCRECLVELLEGAEHLSARTAAEAHLPERFRLSCQARLLTEGPVVCQTLRRGALRIADTGATTPVALRPAVSVDGPGEALGLAMDLGTTTVVLRLYDLRSGVLMATTSFENPQRFGGSDVLARIRFDHDHGGKLLQRTLLGYLGRAIDELPGKRTDIRELVVVGNSTMRDLFFGLDVWPIGQLPYRSVTEHAWRAGESAGTQLVRPARRLRLGLHADAQVYGLPLLSGHVGADAAACLLACAPVGDETVVIVDIGTNTEVVVARGDRVLCASCPAGPAFEGGRITHGMPAMPGAIERVRIAGEAVEIEVVGEVDPVGICGSGLVDALAELRRTGRMNAQGRLEEEEDEDGFALGFGLRLTEADINELAQAKGANIAGARIALDAFGIGRDEVDRWCLAGGFGRHLNLEAAQSIGLIPAVEGWEQVGNAALEGAARALLNVDERRRIEALARTVAHVSLETHADFFDWFVDGCQFERWP